MDLIFNTGEFSQPFYFIQINLVFILTVTIWLDTESLCMTVNVQFCFST